MKPIKGQHFISARKIFESLNKPFISSLKTSSAAAIFSPVAVVLGRGRVEHEDGGDRLLRDAVQVLLPVAQL